MEVTGGPVEERGRIIPNRPNIDRNNWLEVLDMTESLLKLFVNGPEGMYHWPIRGIS